MKSTRFPMMAALVAPCLIGLAACQGNPTYVEQDFGNSVRQMVAAQIYDPEAASNPSNEPPLFIDGVTAEESITGYREDAKRENEDPPAFSINLN